VEVRLKPVLKRPWLHHVIIICYIGAPFANILLLKVFLHVPFKTIFSNLEAGYGVLATVWLLTAPIVGVSLYFVKRFSWYVFLGHSSIILADFVVKWATRPAYYLRTIPGLHNIVLLAGNIALVAIVSYIIQHDFRAPYFQVLNRNWRERSRIPVYHTVTIDGERRTMNDLSTGGCFVLEPGFKHSLGAKVSLSFQSNTLNIECMGEIMRVTDTGLGIRFIRLPSIKKRDIHRMLKNRFTLRQKVDIPCTWIFEEKEIEARMLDLNSGGCYVQAQIDGLRAGSTGRLKVLFQSDRRSFSLPGQVVWINPSGAHEKPVGFGYRFDRRQARFMRDATIQYGLGILVR
jgi:Tfp pilus assembly protein PilZ